MKRLQGCNFGHISVMVMGILGKISFWLFFSRSNCNLQQQASCTSSTMVCSSTHFWVAVLDYLLPMLASIAKGIISNKGRPGQRQGYSNHSFVIHLQRNAES